MCVCVRLGASVTLSIMKETLICHMSKTVANPVSVQDNNVLSDRNQFYLATVYQKMPEVWYYIICYLVMAYLKKFCWLSNGLWFVTYYRQCIVLVFLLLLLKFQVQMNLKIIGHWCVKMLSNFYRWITHYSPVVSCFPVTLNKVSIVFLLLLSLPPILVISCLGNEGL